MSREPIDPEKMTIEGIFRAKDEWRKAQANLPFEEKINILKKLQALAAQIRQAERPSQDNKK